MADEEYKTYGNSQPSERPTALKARPIVYQQRSSANTMSDIRPVSVPRPANTSPVDSQSAPWVPMQDDSFLLDIKGSNTSDKDAKRARKFIKKNKITLALTGLAVAAFIIGIGIGASNLWLNSQTKNKVNAIAATDKNDVPKEDKPSDDDLNNYSVAPDLARLIIIPKINVKARVTQVGVKADNSLVAPLNIYDVGWFSGSSKPGQAGSMVLDGHVHGPTKPGIFENLKYLTVGDVVQIEKGDSEVIKYQVVTTKTYDKDKVDMAAAMVPIIDGKNGLSLITCTGSIDYKTNDYQQRLIVFAVQVD